jgi:hypothetical protein
MFITGLHELHLHTIQNIVSNYESKDFGCFYLNVPQNFHTFMCNDHCIILMSIQVVGIKMIDSLLFLLIFWVKYHQISHWS